jgi:hypothetical protein
VEPESRERKHLPGWRDGSRAVTLLLTLLRINSTLH